MSKFFSFEISSVCRSKYPYSYFSSHFCIFAVAILLIIILFVLYLISAIVFLCSFYVVFMSFYWCIHAPYNTGVLSSSFVFYTNNLPMSWQGCKALCLVVSILVFGPFVCVLSSSLSTTAQNILKKKQPRCLFLMKFLLNSLGSRSFLIYQRLSFLIFLSFPLCLIVSTSNISKYS